MGLPYQELLHSKTGRIDGGALLLWARKNHSENCELALLGEYDEKGCQGNGTRAQRIHIHIRNENRDEELLPKISE
jgi:hypothetical protein